MRHKALDHHVTAGVPAKAMKPGSKAWQQRVTATKIAGLLDCSRYTSFYEAWHTLAGNLPAEPATEAMLRGTHLEKGVADLWAELNGWQIATTGAWQSTEHPWLFATPDRFGRARNTEGDPVGPVHGVEVKTTSTWDGWGEDGSSWLPSDYHWQTLGQHIVTGLPIVVAAMGPGFEVRTYYPVWEQQEREHMLRRIPEILDTLPGRVNHAEPLPDWDNLDTMMQTTPVARGLSITLQDEALLATRYGAARLDLEMAEHEVESLRVEMAQALGEAERMRWRGITLASRTTAGALRTAGPEQLRKVI